MAKNSSKPRRTPLVLSMLGTFGAVAAAVYYKLQLGAPPHVNHGDSLMVIDNQTGDAVEYAPASNRNSLVVPPEFLRQVREEGLTLVYWVSDSGEHLFKTIDESGS